MMASMDAYNNDGVANLGNGKYIVSAPAKLNIKFDIRGKEPNGMHVIETKMQAISLCDYLRIEVVGKGKGHLDGCMIENNNISKAVEKLSEKVGNQLPLKITCHKVIPISAGLGGSSSDAAALIRASNNILDLGLSDNDKDNIASSIGSDVRFLLRGGRAIVEGGTTQKITQIPVPIINYLIATPNKRLSTTEMYKMHDKTGKSFLELASEQCPEIPRLISAMEKCAIELGMTGKGPTVFAGYGSYERCRKVSNKLSWLDGRVFIAKSVGIF